MGRLKYFFLIFSILSLASYGVASERKLLKIGVGNIMEGNYSIALGLCRYISEANPNVDCEVIPAKSSLENIDLLRREVIDLAILQSNTALDAYNGVGYFIDNKPMHNMYQILNLYDSIFTVVVRDDSEILVFKDLEGKKISNGPSGSDSTVAYKALEAFYDFKKPVTDINLDHEQYAKELCDKRVDGIMMMTGHPNALVSLMANSCNVEFISLDEDKVDELIKNNSAFHKKAMHAGLYPGIDHDQVSISAPVILVGTTRTDAVIIRNFLEYINNHIESFKLFHPVLYEFNNDRFQKEFVLPAFENSKEKEG